MRLLNKNRKRTQKHTHTLRETLLIQSIPYFIASSRDQLMLQTQKLASRRSEKPPKLPPRDNIYHPHDIPKPDYDDINEDDRLKAFRVKSDKGRDLNKKYGMIYTHNLQQNQMKKKNQQRNKEIDSVENKTCFGSVKK